MDRFVVPALAALSVLALVVLVLEDAENAPWSDGVSRLVMNGRLESESGTERASHTFLIAPERVRFELGLELADGKAEVRLFTPDGEIAWSERYTSRARATAAETFAGRPGRWRLEVDYSEATGNYELLLGGSRKSR